MKVTNHYDSDYFASRDFLDPIIANSVRIFMTQNHLKSVLDVGCGTGKLVMFLNDSKFQAIGVDNSKIALKFANKNKPRAFYLASAFNLPFQNNQFDLVTCISTIEHLKKNEISTFLKEAFRVLKPSGFIFIVTPNFSSPMRFLKGQQWFAYKDPTHITFLTPTSLKRLLINHGYHNIKTRFKTDYLNPFEISLPTSITFMPMLLKKSLIYLFYSSLAAIFRDSFWMSAQKNKWH